MATLVDAHLAVHLWLEDRAYLVLESLVASDVGTARARFDQLAAILEEHMAFEEEHVLPLYRSVAPADGPGRADHVDGDHVILRRHVDAIDAALVEMEASFTLRSVLERLPVVYRLLATLEHHTAREQKSVYPALAASLDEAARDDVITALKALVSRAPAP